MTKILVFFLFNPKGIYTDLVDVKGYNCAVKEAHKLLLIYLLSFAGFPLPEN